MNRKLILAIEWGCLILSFGLMVIVILYNANPLLFEPGRDGGFFLYAGKELLHGKHLYVDIWDSKGPIIFLLNVIGMWIGGETRWGIWILEFLFFFCSSLLSFTTMKRKWGTFSAFLGTSLWLYGALLLIGKGNTIEEYSLLFDWVAIFIFSKSINSPTNKIYPIIFGSMIGLAFFLRANLIGTIGVIIILWLVMIWKKNNFKKLIHQFSLLIAGVSIIFIPIITIFLVNNTLSEMYNASIIYNFSYSADAQGANIIENGIIPGLLKLNPISYFGIIGYILSVWKIIKSDNNDFDYFLIFLLICWPVEMLASSISGREYGHYYISWLPVLGLLIGLLGDFSNKYIFAPDLVSLVNKRNPFLVPLVGILVLLFFFKDPLSGSIKSVISLMKDRSSGIEYISNEAEYLRQNTDKDDLILAWGGQCGINIMADRGSIRGPMYYPLIVNSPEGKYEQEIFFSSLKNEKPEIIIDASIDAPDDLPPIDPISRNGINLKSTLALNTDEVLEYINDNYIFETEIDGYKIYRMKN